MIDILVLAGCCAG